MIEEVEVQESLIEELKFETDVWLVLTSTAPKSVSVILGCSNVNDQMPLSVKAFS